MIVNGAWNINALPNQIIIELEDGNLVFFFITPFRDIKDEDLKPYTGYHPRKCKGNPLPDYLYPFYGLEKNDESLTEVVRFRLTPTEKTKFESYAASLDGKNMSDVLREFVQSKISDDNQ